MECGISGINATHLLDTKAEIENNSRKTPPSIKKEKRLKPSKRLSLCTLASQVSDKVVPWGCFTDIIESKVVSRRSPVLFKELLPVPSFTYWSSSWLITIGQINNGDKTSVTYTKQPEGQLAKNLQNSVCEMRYINQIKILHDMQKDWRTLLALFNNMNTET